MQAMTIFKKEMVEHWRNFKWIWVPLVFILISIMDPLTTYYLPRILDTVGGMPEGATFDIPQPPAEVAFMMSLSELSSIGVLVIVLITMGIIASERKSGVAELVLVKPVGLLTYIGSKWAAMLVMIWVTLAVSLLASWYYVNLLFGDISFIALLQVIFFYGLWLTFVISLTVFYNTLFKTPGIVGFVTIATIIVMSAFNSIFKHKLTWFPNNLSKHIGDLLDTGIVSGNLIATAVITLILAIGLLFASVITFRQKEMAG